MLKIMRHAHPDLQFTHLLPYGGVLHDHGVQFVVFSRSATSMKLLLYDDVEDEHPSETIEFDRQKDRWGDIWSVFVPGLQDGQLYHFVADGPFDPENGHRFDGNARLVDPYARALAGDYRKMKDGKILPPKCVVVDDYFDWEGDRHIRRDLSESVIYELHVRGFTKHDSSGVEHPGTYLGIIEKIPYLKSLGVTAVELMPVHEFPFGDIGDIPGLHSNYWGYDPVALFAPHQGYAAGDTPGCQVHEFKQMVKELHKAGIEVILDVVFNHTCEGNELGPTLSMKGLENSVYYMLEDDKRHYKNYSGCGNTVNGNHPIVRELIFHCLRHWVHNYHVDGFRFDLASILKRDRTGSLVANPPVVELIGEDPALADTKIIAEAWDAAGAYQVGSFGDDRWAEWNGRYRDDIRRFWRGDGWIRGSMATRIAGSADLYQAWGRPPYCSINFITSHDGFTLNDLVSYNEKHNLANNEDNRDGENNNHSYNFGVEGETDDKAINEIRTRQIKNMLATLLISQGVPMMVAGDECRRTQQGNNNAWCQDNEISWFDWNLVDTNQGLFRFVQGMIGLRESQSILRRQWFLSGTAPTDDHLADIAWFNHHGEEIDWHSDRIPLCCILGSHHEGEPTNEHNRDLMILMNPDDASLDFELPEVSGTRRWRLYADTAASSPDDIFPEQNGPELNCSETIHLIEKSMRIYNSFAE